MQNRHQHHVKTAYFSKIYAKGPELGGSWGRGLFTPAAKWERFYMKKWLPEEGLNFFWTQLLLFCKSAGVYSGHDIEFQTV